MTDNFSKKSISVSDCIFLTHDLSKCKTIYLSNNVDAHFVYGKFHTIFDTNFFSHKIFFYGLAVENIRYVFFLCKYDARDFREFFFFLYSTFVKKYPFSIAYTAISNIDIILYTKHEMCAFSSNFGWSILKPNLIIYLMIKIENL